jgi:hypothetical protein
MGKPAHESWTIDLRSVANTIRWNGEAIDKILDEIPHTEPNSLALVTREPAGVVGAIVPWNFPLVMAAWKLGPALAAGCSVVLKPAEQSPLSALLLAKLALAIDRTGCRVLAIGGGVTANTLLRESVERLGRDRGVDVLIPPRSHCTDNAAMGAIAWERLERGEKDGLELDVLPGTDRSAARRKMA